MNDLIVARRIQRLALVLGVVSIGLVLLVGTLVITTYLKVVG